MLKRIVIDGRAYRRITDAETQNILVANEDERRGKTWKTAISSTQPENLR